MKQITTDIQCGNNHLTLGGSGFFWGEGVEEVIKSYFLQNFFYLELNDAKNI